jgi:uncharacterized protein (TIGR02246 family)
VFERGLEEFIDFSPMVGFHPRFLQSSFGRARPTIYKDTNVTLTVKQIRFLRSDVAVVHVTGHREGPAKELTQDAMLTLMMTKEKQGWMIAAFQNTAITAK